MNIPIRWSDNTADLKKNLAQGLDQIEATRAAADKLVRSLSGDTLIAAAHKYAAAVDKIGDASKLTVANQQRVHEVMVKAVAVMTAAGNGASEVAQHFAALATATEQAKAPVGALAADLEKSGRAAAASLRLIAGMGGGTTPLNQDAEAARGLANAAESATAKLDGMAAGMSRAGQVGAESARMIAGMSASGKQALEQEAQAADAVAAAASRTTGPLDAMASGMSKAGLAATDSARMIAGMSASGKEAVDKEAQAARDLADAAARTKAPLDAMASGMAKAGQVGADSARMIAGMSASGQQALDKEAQAAKDLADAAARAKAPLDAMAAGMAKAGESSADSARMIAGMSASGRQAVTALAQVEQRAKDAAIAFDKLKQRISDWASALRTVGVGLTAGVTVPLVAIAAVSGKAASDFESSFAGVRRTVDGVVDNFGRITDKGTELRQQFRDLAKEMPVSVNELNRIGESAGALDIPLKKVREFTEVMAKLGATTNLTSEEAATSIAKIQNIYQAAGENTTQFASALVSLGINSAATEKDILELSERIAGAGKIAGLAQHDVLAIAAAMSSVGVEAEAGGTAVQKMLLQMVQAVQSGSEKLSIFAKVAGMTAEQFSTAFQHDAAGAFSAFVTGLGEAGNKGIKILADLGLDNQRLIRSFLSLAGAGEMLAKQLDRGNTSWYEGKVLAQAYQQRLETFQSQLAIFRNKLNDVAITIGDSLLPKMTALLKMSQPLIDAAQALAKGFASLPGPIQLAVIGVLGILAAVGPVVLVLGTFARAATALLPILIQLGAVSAETTVMTAAGLVTVETTVGTMIASLGAALGAMILPAAIIAGIIAVTVALKELTGSWTTAFSILVPPVGALMAAWQRLQQQIKDNAAGFIALKEVFGTIDSMIRSGITIAVTNFNTKLAELKERAEKIRETALNMLPDSVRALFTSTTDSVNGTSTALFNLRLQMLDLIPGYRHFVELLALIGNGDAKKDLEDIAASLKRQSDGIEGSIRGARRLTDVYATMPLGHVADGVTLTGKAYAAAAYEAQNLEDRINDLTEVQKKQIVAMHFGKDKFSPASIAKEMPDLGEDVIATFIRQQEALRAELKKTEKAADTYGNAWEEVDALVREHSATTTEVSENTRRVILLFHEMGASVETMTKAHIAERGAIIGVVDAQKDYEASKKRLQEIGIEEHKRAMKEFDEFMDGQKRKAQAIDAGIADNLKAQLEYQRKTKELLAPLLGAELRKIEEQRAAALAALTPPAEGHEAQWKAAVDAINEHFDELKKHADDTRQHIEQVFAEASAGADRVPYHMSRLYEATNLVTDAFTQMGQAAGGAFGAAIVSGGNLYAMIAKIFQLQEKIAHDSKSGPEDQQLLHETKVAAFWQAAAIGMNLLADSINLQGTPVTNNLVRGGALPGQGYTPGTNVGAPTKSFVAAGALKGAAAGVPLAAFTAGASVLVGAGIGAVAGWIQSGKEWRQVINDIGKEFDGLHVPDDFAKAIEDIEKTTGLQSAQAITTQLDKLIEMVGGLNSANFESFTAKLRDVFVFVGRGEMTVAQATEVLDKNFADFAAAGTDSMGFLADSLKEIIRLDEKIGTHSKAITEYLKGQGAAALGASNAIIGSLGPQFTKWTELAERIKAAKKGGADEGKFTEDDGTVRDLSKEERAQYKKDLLEQKTLAGQNSHELANMGVIAVATFAAAVGSGATFNEALAAAAPGLNSLRGAYESLGISTDNVALKALFMQSALLDKNPELIAGIAGLGAGFAALDNMGLLNVETFTAMTETGQSMYERLLASAEEMGGGSRDALLQMQDYLHGAEKAAKDLGIPIDDNTQSLIDQSKELGIWKEKGKSATDKLIDGMDTLVKKVEHLVNTLLGIPDVDYDVTQHNRQVDEGGGEDVPTDTGQRDENGNPIYAATGVDAFRFQSFRPRGTDTIPAMLAPNELVVNEAQTGRLAAALTQGANLLRLEAASAMPSVVAAPLSSASQPLGPIEIVIEVDGQRLGRTVFDPRNLSGATRQRFRAAVHEVGSEVQR